MDFFNKQVVARLERDLEIEKVKNEKLDIEVRQVEALLRCSLSDFLAASYSRDSAMVSGVKNLIKELEESKVELRKHRKKIEKMKLEQSEAKRVAKEDARQRDLDQLVSDAEELMPIGTSFKILDDEYMVMNHISYGVLDCVSSKSKTTTNFTIKNYPCFSDVKKPKSS